MENNFSLHLGDCIVNLKNITDASVDMVLCDLPYGTTQCNWDIIIPFDDLWKELNRVCKKNAAMVFTASQPFTSLLITSNIKNFKYNWVWEKSKATGYLNSNKQPMRAHEDICVFYRKQPTYNPIMVNGTPYNKGEAHRPTDVYGSQKSVLVKSDSGLRFPRTVQYFKTAESEGKVLHPTQKPLALINYLIRTYTNEEDIIIDPVMGSGTTGVAAINLNRKFIGFELDENYFNISQERIQKAVDNKIKTS